MLLKSLIKAAFLPLALILFVPATADAASLSVQALSSQASRVSGGEALIGVSVPAGTDPSDVVVRRNGTVVTGSFGPDPDRPRRLIGLVGGLRPGQNAIAAWAPGLASAPRLNVYNSPITGPLFSGPRQAPFYCTTDRLDAGPPLDADCSAPTTVSYSYRSTSNSFKPLPDPTTRPPDLAQTTTRTGETVDYIVRVEQGTINRAVYRFAVLASGGVTGAGWNERFFYNYGGGCSAGHQQGVTIPSVLNNAQLSRGYAVMSSSLNVLNTSCNDVLSAETTSMVKERAIEVLGRPPVWTAGEGGSGGSVQIQMIAQNYPGLLDGINPSASFPDNSSPDYPDCRLLQRYFESPTGSTLTGAERRAITGLQDPDGCIALAGGADVVNASEGCAELVVPPAVIFDPVTNPDGIRCTVWDNMVNIFGVDPDTGYARRTLDNTGVAYGLKAVQSGAISEEQFLDLNASIGGYDVNGDFTTERSVGDAEGIEISYRTGRFNQGAGGFMAVPIIDDRIYEDEGINVHQYLNTYRLRARLDRFQGGHGNHVMFRAKGGTNTRAMNEASIDLLGQWLDAIAADDSPIPQAQKVLNNRPADAVDACWIGGERVNGEAAIGADNICETTYAPHSLPRNEAGLPLDAVVAKCQLEQPDPADFGSLTQEQAQRLGEIFPQGVCDYSKPGVGEQPVTGTDISFGPPRTTPRVARSLSVRPEPNRVRASSRGRSVRLTATLRPCPETIWQRVIFERSVRKYPQARTGPRSRAMVWRRIGSRIVTGSSCRASTRVDRIRRNTRLRARSEALTGFRGVVAEPRTVRVR
jgi:hypothetical protein